MESQLSFDEISPRLPTRYEDLDESFRGSLRANEALIDAVKAAFKSIRITGGIRFLPIYGLSGSGKSSATLEIATHLPSVEVRKVDPIAVYSPDLIEKEFAGSGFVKSDAPLVAVVDQFEETAADKEKIPTRFVEKLASLDRDYKDRPVLVIWLTTSRVFQKELAEATSRRARLLVSPDFEITGPSRSEWSDIVAETFSAHNSGRELADFEILDSIVNEISLNSDTLGRTIANVATHLATPENDLFDLAEFQVVMLWPVTDGKRIETISRFSSPRQGYRVNWHAFYNQLNAADKAQLPLPGLNKARLYFDLRLVPVAAADLQAVCGSLNAPPVKVNQSALARFKQTHFFSILSRSAPDDSYVTLKERPGSTRSENAVDWYKSVTRKPVEIGKAISKALSDLGLTAKHEVTETSPYGSVRADVYVEREQRPRKVLVEIKAYSPENTRPSDITAQIRITLTKHARFAGFIPRQ